MAKIDHLTTRLHGSLAVAVLSEFFSNSAHFAFTNIIFEGLSEGFYAYLREPDLYSMLFAVTLQAYLVGRAEYLGRPMHFLGNLIGPSVYSAIELALEGLAFFQGLNHIAFWMFAVSVGLIRSRRSHAGRLEGEALLVIENVARATIFAIMYWFFEAKMQPEYAPLQVFLEDGSHVFVILTVPLLGALLGVTSVVAMRRMTMLVNTAGSLRNLSEWSMGRELVSRIVADPKELDLQRRERTVVFMDIRGFTQWSERQVPDAVVAMLNGYFEASEREWNVFDVVIARLIADEVFLVVAKPDDAVVLAARLRSAATLALQPFGLSVGIGINEGPLMEGMIGSEGIRVYDVIGDTVNTGARFCSAAAPGEILVAGDLVDRLGATASFGPIRSIEVKGKSNPVMVRPLLTVQNGR